MTREETNSPPSAPHIPDRARCPSCAAFTHLRTQFLDPRNGKTIRLFECDCGERIWND